MDLAVENGAVLLLYLQRLGHRVDADPPHSHLLLKVGRIVDKAKAVSEGIPVDL